MARAVVNIDDAALAAAAHELGTSTKVETVNRALAEIAARPKRLAFLERLRVADDDLGDPEIVALGRQIGVLLSAQEPALSKAIEAAFDLE